MNKTATLLFISTLLTQEIKAQVYNTLPIPDTVASTFNPGNSRWVYDLRVHENTTQFLPGNETVTAGYNSSKFLGPTIIMRRGTDIQVNVLNLTNEGTTVHWHGIHLPAVMDGGPYQIISPGASWEPYWPVVDNASTYWYHAHLHDATDSLVNMGQAGMLIVQDSVESSLPLPRSYGQDDIPLIMTDKFIDTAGGANATFQLVPGEHSNYMLTNGVINAQTTLPKQVVRLRILNASVFRAFALGLSTSDPMYVIGSDGGLLPSPVTINPGSKFIMAPGERYEVLLNLSGKNIGDSVKIIAYNSTFGVGVPGSLNYGSPVATPSIDSADLLAGKNIQILKIVVGTPKAGGMTSIPTTLIPVPPLDTTAVVKSRNKEFTYYSNYASVPTQVNFGIDSAQFQMGINNDTIALNSMEKWTIENPDTFQGVALSHVFHIHDIQFQIIRIDSVNGNPVPGGTPAYQRGWKDVIMVDYLTRATFVTRFKDYADPMWPFMYHCHMLPHEDGGMMGQFIVVGDPAAVSVRNTPGSAESDVNIYPNPAADRLHIDLSDKSAAVYYVTIYDVLGRKKFMLPKPMVSDALDVSMLTPGDYLLKILDTKGNTAYKKFTKM
jgi:bilirubin oxidase